MNFDIDNEVHVVEDPKTIYTIEGKKKKTNEFSYKLQAKGEKLGWLNFSVDKSEIEHVGKSRNAK